MNTQLKEIAKVWPNIQSVFSVPHNEKDYNNLVDLLDRLGLRDDVELTAAGDQHRCPAERLEVTGFAGVQPPHALGDEAKLAAVG